VTELIMNVINNNSVLWKDWIEIWQNVLLEFYITGKEIQLEYKYIWAYDITYYIQPHLYNSLLYVPTFWHGNV